MDELLSVIIPVYQAEKYLQECVESVLNQYYRNIEIILVDDGSLDASPLLCDELAEKDGRVRTVHIPNGGPFEARKVGVKCARGKVITFVDADDWVEKNIYLDLMSIYEEHKPDIISYSFKVDVSGRISENYYDEGIYHKPEIEELFIPTMMYDIKIGARKFNPSICCKIINKSIYEKITEELTGRIDLGEDALVTYPAMCVIESIYISQKAYYNYRVNQNSATHRYPASRIDELDNFYGNIQKLLNKFGSKYDLRLQLECYMRNFIEALMVNRFNVHRTGTMYRFPYREIRKDSKLLIYGAGEVGKSYVCELLQSGYAEVCGWYDRNAERLQQYAGVQICLPGENIKYAEKDMVVVAIQEKSMAEKIRGELIALGVNPDEIYWSKPIARI